MGILSFKEGMVVYVVSYQLTKPLNQKMRNLKPN